MLPFAFGLYQRLRAADPRVQRRNREHAPPADGLPVPPARLIMAVAGTPEIETYLQGGELAAASIRELLAKNGLDLGAFGAVLDFGCGCGRVLRHWADLKNTEVHGTDYNPELARWCAENLPFARIGTNSLAPPLGYRDAQFDFVYALSVLTHLPEPDQLAWMQEFRRILKPGGCLLVSTHGACYLPQLSPAEQEQFQQSRLVVRHGRSAGSNLCSTFHPESYVRGNLTLGFGVADFVPEGARGNPRQDAWLLRRL